MCILVCGGGATYGRICVAWHEPCATGQLLLLPLTHSIHRLFCNMLLLLVYFFFFFSLCIDWNRLQYAIKPIFLFWLLEEEGTTRKSCRKKTQQQRNALLCVFESGATEKGDLVLFRRRFCLSGREKTLS